MDYLKRAVELSIISLNSGCFPAGAVIVTKTGSIYESDPSVGHYHGELMAIDKAIKAEGAPLTDAVIYSSMQPCLMCSAKMYWSGVTTSYYVIPKSEVDAEYAYENKDNLTDIVKTFFTKTNFINDTKYLQEALDAYKEWIKKNNLK